MEKLYLLNPVIKKGYLANKNREKMEYLQIPENLTLDMLKADIDAGAKQFADVEKFLKKPSNRRSRYVFIKSTTKEDGLLAVTYLSGIMNANPGARDEDMDFGDNGDYRDEEDWDLDLCDEEDSTFSSYESEMINADDLWVESNWRIPLVDINELKKYRRGIGEPMAISLGDMLGGGLIRDMGEPYWTDCREGSICILIPGDYNLDKSTVQLFDGFTQNKNVFILRYDERGSAPVGEALDGYLPDRDFEYELLLECCSDSVNVELKKEDAFNYYKKVFEGWLERYGLVTDKDFPMDEVVTQLMRVKRGDKSHMMDRLLNVLCKNEDVCGELKKEHLNRIGIFKYIFGAENMSEDNALKRLETELIGLKTVKEQVRDIVNTMKLNNLRERAGISEGGPHNVILMLGAPGTAKTTVGRLLGNIMMEENLLPGNRFVCVNGAELKGKFVGHSAPKTKQIFDDYDVIMIDEAYSLSASGSGGMDAFAQEALAQLMIELENHSRDKLVMFAGYGGEGVSMENNRMLEFINANPGLASRISYTIEFPTYTAQDMVEIVHKQAELMKFKLDRFADTELLEYFSERICDKTFGNGREARSLIENCQCFMARRILTGQDEKQDKKYDKRELETIIKSDVTQAIERLKTARRSQNGVGQRFGFL